MLCLCGTPLAAMCPHVTVKKLAFARRRDEFAVQFRTEFATNQLQSMRIGSGNSYPRGPAPMLWEQVHADMNCDVTGHSQHLFCRSQQHRSQHTQLFFTQLL